MKLYNWIESKDDNNQNNDNDSSNDNTTGRTDFDLNDQGDTRNDVGRDKHKIS